MHKVFNTVETVPQEGLLTGVTSQRTEESKGDLGGGDMASRKKSQNSKIFCSLQFGNKGKAKKTI